MQEPNCFNPAASLTVLCLRKSPIQLIDIMSIFHRIDDAGRSQTIIDIACHLLICFMRWRCFDENNIRKIIKYCHALENPVISSSILICHCRVGPRCLQLLKGTPFQTDAYDRVMDALTPGQFLHFPKESRDRSLAFEMATVLRDRGFLSGTISNTADLMKQYRKNITHQSPRDSTGAHTRPDGSDISHVADIRFQMHPRRKQAIRNLKDIVSKNFGTREKDEGDAQHQKMGLGFPRRLVISDCALPMCRQTVWNISHPFRSWRSKYIEGYSPYVLHLLSRHADSTDELDFHKLIDKEVMSSRSQLCIDLSTQCV